MMTRMGALLVAGLLLGAGVAGADEAPISGTVKAVDAGARTITLESTAQGKTSDPAGWSA
jgi:hypothetical protein